MPRCVVLIITTKCYEDSLRVCIVCLFVLQTLAMSLTLLTTSFIFFFFFISSTGVVVAFSPLILLLSGHRSALGTLTEVVGVGPSLSQSHERRVLLHLRSHLHELHLRSHLLDRQNRTRQLRRSSHLLSGRHSLLVLHATREQHQLALVRVQTLHVRLQRLHGVVHTAMIHRNTDGTSLAGVDSGLLFHYHAHRTETHLQLSQSESTTQSGFHVVLLSGAVDDGAEQSGSRARSDRGGLLLAEQSAASLLSSLIEPGLHTAIPVLLKVSIR